MTEENIKFLCRLFILAVAFAGTFFLIGIDYAIDYQKSAQEKAVRGMWK